MLKTNTPFQIWCFYYEYSANILSVLDTGHFDLQGRSPYEVVMNYIPYILSIYLIHVFNRVSISVNQPKVNDHVFLGPSHQVRQAFFSYIILDNSQYISRLSIIGIPQDELLSDHMK